MNQLPVLESDRLNLGGELIISVNRSWQVPAVTHGRPVARFRGMAPLFVVEGEGGVRVLAAVAPWDAVWLGFETRGDASFAIVPLIDGRNALTDEAGDLERLRAAPPNFLLAPDHPWFDCTPRPDGGFAQMVPPFVPESELGGRRPVKHIQLIIFSVDAPKRQAMNSEGTPIPLYTQSSKQASPARHVWDARELSSTVLDVEPRVKLTLELNHPLQFQERSGRKLPAEFFEEPQGPPPAPHNPFGFTS